MFLASIEYFEIFYKITKDFKYFKGMIEYFEEISMTLHYFPSRLQRVPKTFFSAILTLFFQKLDLIGKN